MSKVPDCMPDSPALVLRVILRAWCCPCLRTRRVPPVPPPRLCRVRKSGLTGSSPIGCTIAGPLSRFVQYASLLERRHHSLPSDSPSHWCGARL